MLPDHIWQVSVALLQADFAPDGIPDPVPICRMQACGSNCPFGHLQKIAICILERGGFLWQHLS